jgi:methylmalonyl-CoA mutase, N-terminal domain
LRNARAVQSALTALAAAAPQYNERSTSIGGAERATLMPLIIDAVRARASVGEIADTLESAWGRYRPPT